MAYPEGFNTGLTEESIAEAFRKALNSVQNEPDKGLSSNDFNDEYKAMLDGLNERLSAIEGRIEALEGGDE